MKPLLEVLNDLAYIHECLAVDYTGEAKHQLSQLANRLESNPIDAVGDCAAVVATVRACRQMLVDTPADKFGCALKLGMLSRSLWDRHHRLEAALRDSDTERDLCSLTVNALAAAPAQLGSAASAHVGDRIYAIGAPQGLELTLSDGLISSLRSLDGGNILQVTAPISHGSSGGGLFDAHARLIGITTMYLSDSQQLNFAVPVEWISELPNRNRGAKQYARATEAARDEGRLALNALGQELYAADPTAYLASLDRLVAQIAEIKASLPPDQWVAATRRAYAAIAVSTENRWILVSEDSTMAVHVDRETINRSGDVVEVWVRVKYASATPLADLPAVKKTLSYQSINCSRRIVSIQSTAFYGAGGELLASNEYSGDEARFSVEPQSVVEATMKLVCKTP